MATNGERCRSHASVRLEKSGEVVAYLAPECEVFIATGTEIEHERAGSPIPVAEPSGQPETKIVVHGKFRPTDSESVSESKANDIESMFGSTPVSARDQFTRLRYGVETGGLFEFYEHGDEYVARSSDEIDWRDGMMPAVEIEECLPLTVGNQPEMEYRITMAVAQATEFGEQHG